MHLTYFHERNNHKTGNQRYTPKNYGLRQSASITLRPTFSPSFDQRCDKQSGRVQLKAIPRGYELV